MLAAMRFATIHFKFFFLSLKNYADFYCHTKFNKTKAIFIFNLLLNGYYFDHRKTKLLVIPYKVIPISFIFYIIFYYKSDSLENLLIFLIRLICK